MRPTLRQRLRYRFDNLMARGTGPQVAMLALLSIVIVVSTALLVAAARLHPDAAGDEAPEMSALLWDSFMRALDPGGVGGDTGSAALLAAMLLATLGGIFVLSAFIGVLNRFLAETLDSLRKGRSPVIERGHTVILGFTPKIHTLLAELAEANANQPRACVVILSGEDKVTMDDEIRARLRRRLRVVTRTGNPMSVVDLGRVNLPAAKAIIVMSPEHDERNEPILPHQADTIVLKTLLAISKAGGGRKLHVVAELQDEKILTVARMVTGEDAALLLGPPLISRLLVHTGRFSGLSAVYQELFDFGGSEIYIQPEPGLQGRSFREALTAYDDSSLIGVLGADGQLHLPPPFAYVLQSGDLVVVIAEDDDTAILNGRPGPLREEALVRAAPVPKKRAERTLILGTNERLQLVLRELAPYGSLGSQTLVVGENDEVGEAAAAAARTQFPHLNVAFRRGDISDRALLDSLGVLSYEHVLVLSETAGRSHDVADARTMVTLLHLRDLMRRGGKTVPVTTEILDIANRELAAVAEADDFIVSNTLTALLVAQVAENKHLARVFDELMTYGGHDIRIRPATHYVTPGIEVDLYHVVEAAARRNEVVIGYRLGAEAKDPARHFGVRVNPKKHERMVFMERDEVVVLTQV
jgi:ion channel POLLUX/CASTOR